MRWYPVKENPIGSAVSEILWYRQIDTHTNRQTSLYFIIRIDIKIRHTDKSKYKKIGSLEVKRKGLKNTHTLSGKGI